MEVSVMGSLQVNIGRNNDIGFFSFSKNLNTMECNLKNNHNYSKGCNFGRSLVWPSKSAFGFTLRSSATSENGVSFIPEKASNISRTIDCLKFYVGLPLDTVSNCNTINHTRAIATGLKALKLLGIDGVELPVYWGIAEKEAMGKYEWRSYLAVVEMVQKLGLKLHVSLCFHSSEEHEIQLPEWVSRVGESEPGIYFTDRSRLQCKKCLSLAVDDLPVLDGKTPVEVYKAFCDSFKSTFSGFLGSTITGISIGLGPEGELRYPSHHHSFNNSGAGEFQCYDKFMLGNLKQHAEMHGNPLWGLGGPHDAPSYNDLNPISSGFFMENGGSWESLYGNFFLCWYSSLLVSHGDRILSLAASSFKDVPISISAKVPLIHSWYKSRSHPSELAAGFYNTDNRAGYKAIAEIFSRNSCKMILPGMDLSDNHQSAVSLSSPEMLLRQITSSCRDHGVKISGQNLSALGDSSNFEQIKKVLLDENATTDLFTYQRMGAYFFSPEHFPLFAQCLCIMRIPVAASNRSYINSRSLKI
ncbi:inactive beta-amylase 9-like [Dorcoceras hygrometricum]|uniref:Beta-amylase n=1 Tax=Dorcoceras hygrometricum TaxID=472368 RepID=A0A2Z7B8A4_9LAMI|nr:inactive beta-amylase 9-like [Dorcoceras hygrometricum]